MAKLAFGGLVVSPAPSQTFPKTQAIPTAVQAQSPPVAPWKGLMLLTAGLCGVNLQPHFTDEKTKAWEDELARPEPHSQKVAQLNLAHRLMNSEGKFLFLLPHLLALLPAGARPN